MNYKLVKKATNKVKTTFQVLDSSGDIVGSINVKPSEEQDLLRHWNRPTVQPKALAAVGSSSNTDPIVQALP
jgi:hypothetical protein